MFKTFSMTGSGMLVLGLTAFLSWIGIVPDNTQVQVWAKDILDLVGLVLMIWGQFTRKDLSWGFWRV